MTTAANGGAAFPHLTMLTDYGQSSAEVGMDLRDYFAAKVLPALVSDGSALDGIMVAANKSGMDGVAVTAQICYLYADAMIAERAK